MTDSRILRWLAWRLADSGIFRVSIEETFKRRMIAHPTVESLHGIDDDDVEGDRSVSQRAASG